MVIRTPGGRPQPPLISRELVRPELDFQQHAVKPNGPSDRGRMGHCGCQTEPRGFAVPACSRCNPILGCEWEENHMAHGCALPGLRRSQYKSSHMQSHRDKIN